MKKFLKYGLVSLSLLTLGLSVTTTDLPVVGVQRVSASGVAAGDPLEQFSKLDSSSSSAEIKAAIAKVRDLEAHWQKTIKSSELDVQNIEQMGILPPSTQAKRDNFENRVKQLEVELQVKQELLAQLTDEFLAKVVEIREALANATGDDKLLLKDAERALSKQFSSDRGRFEGEIDNLRFSLQREKDFLDALTVEKVKERLNRELSSSIQHKVRVAKRLAELEKADAVALKREAKEEALRQLTSQTHPIAVTVGKADAGKIKSITTVAVTGRNVLSKLPASHKPSRVSLYDIKVIDGSGQVSQISEPATVTLPVDSKRKVVQVIYFLPETGAIDDLAFTLSADGKSVSFTVEHFSHYGVVYEDQSTDSSTSSTSTSSSDNSTQPSTSSSTNPTAQGDTTTEGSSQSSSSDATANASVKVADTATTEQKVLPKTGEQSTGLSLIAGLGLLLSGFGLKHYRKKD